MSKLNGITSSSSGNSHEDNTVAVPLRSDEIAASSVRSGLAELERQTSKTLQNLENLRIGERGGGGPGTVVMVTRPTQSPSTQPSATSVASSLSGSIQESNSILRADLLDSSPESQSKSGPRRIAAGLRDERLAPNDIFKSLEFLIRESNNNNNNNTQDSCDEYKSTENEQEFLLPAIDEISHLALISHSVVAYLVYLERNQLLRVTDQVSNDVVRWLNRLLQIEMMEANYVDNIEEATVKLLRLVLMTNYGDQQMLECNGFRPMTGQISLYVSEMNPMYMKLQYACQQLGFPITSIRRIPTCIRGNRGNRGSNVLSMDHLALAKQVQIDLAEQRKPLMLVVDVSESIWGNVDDLSRLHTICKAHGIWIHASGHGLAAFAAGTTTTTEFSSIVDSMVLNLGTWLGVASLPIVTLYRDRVLNNLEKKHNLQRRLSSLILWTSLQAIGSRKITERIQTSLQTCRMLYDDLIDCDGVRIISRGLESSSPSSESMNTMKSIEGFFSLDNVLCTVVFQFDGNYTKEEEETSSSDCKDEKILEKVHNTSYYDRLNSWLGQILQRNFPEFNLHMVDHDEYGTSIRFCPFEMGLGETPPSMESMQKLCTSVNLHVDILRATVKHKVHFMELVESNEYLRLVELTEWAGMGGVRFVPLGWENFLTDQAKTELNKLNIDLVESLKVTDSAFSMGEGPDGLICVRFGMVTHETDIEELLDLVVSVGKTVQENSRVLDSMSAIVKKGIETAMADLQRESEEKLWQEGIFRHVPVLGRVVNWWSPPVKETGIRGRSLNLTQGVVESTENIYKYHMQMSGALSQTYTNKSPPTPLVQTSLKYPMDEELELTYKRNILQDNQSINDLEQHDKLTTNTEEH